MLWVSLYPAGHQRGLSPDTLPASIGMFVPLRLGWQWVSANDTCWFQNLLWAVGAVGWGWHSFVMVSCQSQLLVAMYIKSRWLFSKYYQKTIFSFRFCFYFRNISGWSTSPRCRPTMWKVNRATQDVCQIHW